MTSDHSKRHRPIELLAPAGDWECARAAIENGADAIYFGLDCGFNARHRAKNFGTADLAELTRLLRRRGVRGYVTMNTLAFPSELPRLIDVIETVAAAGIDAVLVQDFGVARLVRAVCPELEVHASTQMSLTSAETIAVASRLGLARVVLARELSVAEIRKISAATDMPLEVFIHGALCVAYSGQCLTSESLGGRSANRGQCAQACRLPYDLICDGQDQDLGSVRYLLSPQDLAGYAAIPALIDAGVSSLKIEGRLKTPEYVANITRHYRQAIDQAISSGNVAVSDQARREMELSFSRGLSPGWLEGNDHKRLVPGITSAKRGIELGRVIQARGNRLQIELSAAVALGDGLGIAGENGTFQGGRVYALVDQHGTAQQLAEQGHTVWIGFGQGEIDWHRVQSGALVYKNDDPKLNRMLRQSFSGQDPHRRQPVDLTVFAETGKPLRLGGWIDQGIQGEVVGVEPLSAARTHPADEAMLRDKLGRLGGTPLRLRNFRAEIRGGPMVPVGMLNRMRRDLVARLLAKLEEAPERVIRPQAGRQLIQPSASTTAPSASSAQLAVLCRTLEQTEAACRLDVGMVYADFHDIRQYRDAVQIAREHNARIGLASVRIQKPGEMSLCRVLGRHGPDCVLARNLAAIDSIARAGMEVIADFSLNVSNQASAEWLRSLGVQRCTASYDLNRDQLLDLVTAFPANRIEVVIHQHMPMFHMEHCVFCAVLSPGTNKTNCGRPCDRHVVQLRDRVGAQHSLQADVACRNTLYNATAQSGAEIVNTLMRRGVGWLRMELLEEDASETKNTITIYQRLLAGELSGRDVWQRLNAANRLGVTRGTLESKRDPLAIL